MLRPPCRAGRPTTSDRRPGAVATELLSHQRADVREAYQNRFLGKDLLEATDMAEAITYVVTRPRHVAVNEILVRPTQQQA